MDFRTQVTRQVHEMAREGCHPFGDVRVCMLLHGLNRIGGTERQALQLARELRNLGIGVSFVTTWAQEGQGGENIPLGGLNVYSLSSPRLFWPGILRALWFLCGSLFLLVKHRRQYDVIHAHQLSVAGVIACIAGRFLKRPVIILDVAAGPIGDVAQLKRSWLSSWRASLLQAANYYIALTPEIRDELKNLGLPETKILTIPNGVNTNFFQPYLGAKAELRKTLSLPVSGKIVVFVGRLTGVKRLDFLLDAWKIVSDQEINATLLIIGDGPLKVGLVRKAKSLGVSSSVLFLGALPVDRVRDHLQASDLFVLPSASEGMPNALLEATACSLPAVGTDIPSIRNVIENEEEGLLFRRDDKGDLADRILALLCDDERRRRMGQKARQKIQKKYTLARIAERYAEIYRELCSP